MNNYKFVRQVLVEHWLTYDYLSCMSLIIIHSGEIQYPLRCESG